MRIGRKRAGSMGAIHSARKSPRENALGIISRQGWPEKVREASKIRERNQRAKLSRTFSQAIEMPDFWHTCRAHHLKKWRL
jgi:hypothetical protein